MEIAGLKEGSYTHEVWKNIGVKGTYYPQTSNIATIEVIRDGGIGIVPIMNTIGGSVREEIERIINLISLSHIKGWYNLHIQHVLAGSGEISDLTEIHAHPQALMQCALGLKNIGASTKDLINNYNLIREIPNTTQYIIEINDKIGILDEITAILEKKRINIRHIHSFPSGKGKYRFYTMFDNSNISLSFLDKELENIGGKIIKPNKKAEDDGKIKLVSRSTNVDGIPEAKENSNIGVICSKQAAEDNGLDILNPNFSHKDNITSFIVLANNQTNIHISNFQGIVRDRVLGLLTLPNKIGILRKALSIIRNVGLSLSLILSLKDGEGGCRIALVMNKGVNGEIMSIQKDLSKLQGSLKVM